MRSLEGHHEAGPIAHFTDRGLVPNLHLFSRSHQPRIHARHLPLQRGHGTAAPVDQLQSHRRQLFVPRRQPFQARLVGPCLEEAVPARHNLTVTDQDRPMRRIQAPGKPVNEVTPRRGRPVHDGEILPAECNGPRPRTRRSQHPPRSRVASGDSTPHGRCPVGTAEIPGKRGRLRSPAGDLTETKRPEGPPGEEKPERLEEVGLSLRVGPPDQVEPRRWRVAQGAVVSIVTELNPAYLHPI